MSIRINWANPSTAFDSVRIYRTAAPFDYGNIPASPLATLSAGETTYLDTTTAQKVYYYYTVAVVKGAEVVLSPPKLAIHMPYTGPGPQSLLCGDWNRGFFGVLTAAELYTNLELAAATGMGAVQQAVENTWLKFVYKGKILFMPFVAVSLNTGWNSLYARGLVFGTDDTGVGPHGLTPVNQRKVITKNGHSYVVRLPRLNETVDFSSATVDPNVGEWRPLYGCAMSLGTANLGILCDYVLATYFTGSWVAVAPMAEYVNTYAMHINASGNPTPGSTSCVRATNTYNWRPVLELIL